MRKVFLVGIAVWLLGIAVSVVLWRTGAAGSTPVWVCTAGVALGGVGLVWAGGHRR